MILIDANSEPALTAGKQCFSYSTLFRLALAINKTKPWLKSDQELLHCKPIPVFITGMGLQCSVPQINNKYMDS